MEHQMKIQLTPFNDLKSGRKTCEVRNLSDREFREGDTVRLNLIDETSNPTGISMVRTITHVQYGYGLPDDVCVLSYAQPEDVRAMVDDRTPQDYAIEHAGYLATAADSVQEAYKAYSLAQMNVDEGGDDGEGELTEMVDDARNDLHEALQNMRGMAFEFRKRRDRATPQ